MAAFLIAISLAGEIYSHKKNAFFGRVPAFCGGGGVRQVGMDAYGELIVNPEMEAAANSRLNLTLAGTA